MADAFEPFLRAAAGLPAAVSDAVPIAHVYADARRPGTVTTITAGELRALVATARPGESRATSWPDAVPGAGQSPVRQEEGSRGGAPNEAELERLADDFVLRVSEWDDRTSPEDWPEALLITRGELKCELLGFVREAMLSAAPPPDANSGGETFQTIAQWCEETFGPIEPARIVSRAAEEMEELRAEPEKVEEAADVVIVLARYPGLWAMVERKMRVNRERKWRLMGDGTGYHIKDASPRPSSQEVGDA